MARGDVLQWGFTTDTDGKVINVTIAGGQKPDLTFDTPEAFTEWFDEEWHGLQIGRMKAAKIASTSGAASEPSFTKFPFHEKWTVPCGYICSPERPWADCPIHGSKKDA